MMVIELRAAFVQQVLDRQLSLPLNQCLRSIDQHFHAMHCQDRRLELFTLRTSSQQRKPSDPNTLPSESCQCCSHALPCHASICTYWPRELYMICVSWESCDKHAHIVTRPWQWLWHCSYYCECQPCDCESVTAHADLGMWATQPILGLTQQRQPGKSNKLQNQNRGRQFCRLLFASWVLIKIWRDS